MQRKWRREWEHRKGSQLAVRSTNYGRGVLKTLTRTILPPVAAATMLLSSMIMPAYANPTGGQITSGIGSIAQTGNTMNITQNTNKLSINWQSFNIAKNETVNFQQPGAGAIALNRVVGNNASSIYGHLNANGQVFLINTNGVLFAPGSSVKIGGLVASTLNISDRDFQNGNYKFSGTGGSVVNQGTLTATDGGYVALLGNQVANQGVVMANQGTVALGAGNTATLDFNGDGLYSLAVTEAALNAQASNQNLIQANGGQVYMTARAANTLAGTVLNNSGVIEAQTINNKNGVILLDGGPSGAVTNSGTLDASGKTAGQTGGTVKVLGDNLTLAAGTKIDVSGANGGGTALIGGNAHGQGSEQNATTTAVAKGATINADAITTGNGGQVVVWSDKATSFAGTITVRGGSASGNGGRVETSGQKLTVGDSALVTTLAAHGANGNWLLDPDGFTIGADGDMSGVALSSALANGDVTITSTNGRGTDGNINVNEAVTWAANTTLELTATNSLNINETITATGDNAGLTLTATGGDINVNAPVALSGGHAALAMTYGGDYNIRTKASYSGAVIGSDGYPAAKVDTSGGVYGSITLSGANASLAINNQNYTLIHSLDQLAALDDATGTAGGNFALAQDLDASGTTYSATGGTCFGVVAKLSGTLTGLGHTISNLTINAPTTPNVGLVGQTLAGSTIRDIGLVDASVTGRGSIGTLLGWGATTAVKNVYATGSVVSAATVPGQGNNIGGLIGRLQGGSISSSYTDVAVNGWTGVGGLVGLAQANGAVGVTISDSHAEGAVTVKSSTVGGLVGNLSAGSLIFSYATGDVTNSVGGNYQGGLVGSVGNGSSVSYSFASGKVITGGTSSYIGGLAGQNYGTLDHVYATGDVSGYYQVGGLVGSLQVNSLDHSSGGSISNAYATGTVTGNENVGGLVGSIGQYAVVTNSHATGAVTAGAGGAAGGFAGVNFAPSTAVMPPGM